MVNGYHEGKHIASIHAVDALVSLTAAYYRLEPGSDDTAEATQALQAIRRLVNKMLEPYYMGVGPTQVIPAKEEG